MMSNFIPHKTIKVVPRDPPWTSKNLKTLLNRQKRLFRNYKRGGSKPADKIRVNSFRDDFTSAILKAKTDYLSKIGSELSVPST